MPRYLLQNRITKESRIVEAPFAQDACERVGWMIGDCYVKRLLDTGRSKPVVGGMDDIDFGVALNQGRYPERKA